MCSFRQHSLNRDYSSEVFPSDGSYYKTDTDKSRVTSMNKIVKSCSPVMLSQQLHSVSFLLMMKFYILNVRKLAGNRLSFVKIPAIPLRYDAFYDARSDIIKT